VEIPGQGRQIVLGRLSPPRRFGKSYWGGSIPYLEKKMTDQPQQTNPDEHRYYPEDEIELMDILRGIRR